MLPSEVPASSSAPSHASPSERTCPASVVSASISDWADLTSDDYLFKEFLPKMAAYSLLKPRAVNCDPSLVLFIAMDDALQKVASRH